MKQKKNITDQTDSDIESKMIVFDKTKDNVIQYVHQNYSDNEDNPQTDYARAYRDRKNNRTQAKAKQKQYKLDCKSRELMLTREFKLNKLDIDIRANYFHDFIYAENTEPIDLETVVSKAIILDFLLTKTNYKKLIRKYIGVDSVNVDYYSDTDSNSDENLNENYLEYPEAFYPNKYYAIKLFYEKEKDMAIKEYYLANRTKKIPDPVRIEYKNQFKKWDMEISSSKKAKTIVDI
jgi:hypothetical protein